MTGPRWGLTGVMISQAIVAAGAAKLASRQRLYGLEVQQSVVAQLLLGVGMESGVNEVAQLLMPPEKWETVERMPPKAKWLEVSAFDGRVPFAVDEEPMLTVALASAARNELAHPKPFDPGGQIDLQLMDGTLVLGADPDSPMIEGAQFVRPVLHLRDQRNLNAKSTIEMAQRVTHALITLREHTEIREPIFRAMHELQARANDLAREKGVLWSPLPCADRCR